MFQQVFKSILLSSLLTFPVSIFYFNLTINVAESRVGIPHQGLIPPNPPYHGLTPPNPPYQENEVENIAIQMTVQISSGDRRGSGIIIKKEGNVYTVLTNRHVISQGNKTTVVTPDGEVVEATPVSEVNLSNLDVFLLRFNSAGSYGIAEFTNPQNLTTNTVIYAAGFPYQTNKFTFVSGSLIESPNMAFKEGYQLGYDLNYDEEIAKGMSGGPILTEQGKVIGINGIHASAVTILYNPFVYANGQAPTAAELDRFTRYNWGIPITNISENIPQYVSFRDGNREQIRTVNPKEGDNTVFNEVKRQAQKFTVRLELLSENSRGSGVIIAKKNNTYYVLSSSHVVEELTKPRNLQVITPDGQIQAANNETVILFRGLDLALIEFNSNKSYEVATLAAHKPNQTGDNFTFVGGFPAETPEQFTFTAGQIFEEQRAVATKVGNTDNLGTGFDLVYTNITQAGMSGGPVLDLRGNVVGIHGRVEGENIIQQATGKRETVILGYSFGVPIASFLGRLESCSISPNQQCPNLTRQSLKLYNSPLPELTFEESQGIRATFPQPVSPTANNPFDWLNYGNQLWRLERYGEAIAAFDRALTLDSEVYLAWYAKAQSYYNSGEYELALAALNRTLELKSDLAIAWTLKGNTLLLLGNNLEAIAAFDRALELSRNNPQQQFSPHMWRGLALDYLGRYEESAESYSRALRIREHSWAYYNRGIVHNSAGKYQEALADYNRAIELNPLYTDAYNNRGIVYENLKEYDLAFADYSKAIEVDPWYSRGYYNRGNIYRERERYQEALADYNQAIELNPEYAVAYYNRGIVHNNLTEYDRAIADYTQVVRLDPQYVNAYYNRGNIYRILEKHQEAIADYTKVIELNPQDVDAYNNRGIVYNNLQDYDRAIADYSKAIELEPNYALAYYNRGNIYRHRQEYEQALVDYNRAIELNPQYPNAYNNRGIVYDMLQRYPEAIADYGKVIELDPEYTNAYYNRGIIYNTLQKYPEAIADYTKAIELAPDYINAYYNRGNTHRSLQQYQQAVLDYTKVIELDPQDADAYNNRGISYHGLKQYEEAIADYNKALTIDPNYGRAYYNRGLSNSALGKYNEAIADYTRAIEVEPNYVSAYYNRGILYYDLEEYQKAIDDYTTAIKINPQHANAYYNRALSYHYLENYTEARKNYQKAAELYQQQGQKEYYQDTINQLNHLPQ
jgi:tetratricopeptide (TPR) repeat protein/S1-C subfamily serine protease